MCCNCCDPYYCDRCDQECRMECPHLWDPEWTDEDEEDEEE